MQEYGEDIAKVHIKYSKKEQIALWEKMQAGDSSARDKIIFSCLPLVVNIANKFRVNNKHIDLEDMVQEGNIALLEAVDRWDANRAAITTVATWYVRNALIDMIHDGKYKIKNPLSLSRRAAEELCKIKRVENEFNTQDVKQISEKTNMTEKRVAKLLSVAQNKRYSPHEIEVPIDFEEDQAPTRPCMADLISLAEETLDSTEKNVFFMWSGIKSKKEGVKKISQSMDFTVKETMSILSKAKRKLKNAAKMEEGDPCLNTM